MIRSFIPYFLLLFLLPFYGGAQYNQLLHKPYAERVGGLHAMYKDMIDAKDSVARKAMAEEIKQFARDHHDRALELEVQFFQVFWNVFYQKQPKKVSLVQLKKQLAEVSNENIDFLKARTLRITAEFYWKIEKNYELAFEQYLLLDKELKTIKAADYPEMVRDFMQIGEAYYFFQDYSLAKKYFKKAIALPETAFNAIVINAARNTLGLCYQQLGELDSADHYFDEVRHTAYPQAVVWKRIATGNKGTSMYLRKQYDQAVPLLEIDFKGAVAEGDHGCAAGAAITLADIYREKQQMAKAGLYISNARRYISLAGQPDRLRLLYPVMSKWYAASGDIENSKRYLDSAITALNSYNGNFSALKVLKAQQKVDLQQEQLHLTAFTLEKQRKINERNLVIVIAVALGLLLVFGYFYFKRRQQAMEIEKLRVEGELKKAQLEMDRFIYKINEQTKLTEKFTAELNKLQESESEERKILESTLVELRAVKILTDEDWLSFQQHFGKIFPAFIGNLKVNHPSVTEAETRYLMLAKLQLSHKEMAHALGISPDAVRVTWNRVRKKLDGNLNDTPQSLLAGF